MIDTKLDKAIAEHELRMQGRLASFANTCRRAAAYPKSAHLLKIPERIREQIFRGRSAA